MTRRPWLLSMFKNIILFMNKIVVFFFILASSFCYSQDFNAGTIIGINTSQVSGDNLSGFNKLGLRIGGFVTREFRNFDGQIELQYINKGSRELIAQNTYNEGYKFQVNYIEIPISIKKTISKNSHVELGFSIGHLLNWIEEYDGIDDYGIDIKKIEYSCHIGFQYKINPNLYFNSRFSNSLSPIRPHSLSQHNSDSNVYQWNRGQYNTSISFVIKYYFLKK